MYRMGKKNMPAMAAGVILLAGGVAAAVICHSMNQKSKKRIKHYATKMLEEMESAAMEICPWCR